MIKKGELMNSVSVPPPKKGAIAKFSLQQHLLFVLLNSCHNFVGYKRSTVSLVPYLNFRIASIYSPSDMAVFPSLPTVVFAQTIEFRMDSSTVSATALKTKFKLSS